MRALLPRHRHVSMADIDIRRFDARAGNSFERAKVY
jgi:hypothetical protein